MKKVNNLFQEGLNVIEAERKILSREVRILKMKDRNGISKKISEKSGFIVIKKEEWKYRKG